MIAAGLNSMDELDAVEALEKKEKGERLAQLAEAKRSGEGRSVEPTTFADGSSLDSFSAFGLSPLYLDVVEAFSEDFDPSDPFWLSLVDVGFDGGTVP